ncbi:g2276 [Coccomyxa viridis]|uniref:G2276 protein n=1 Tax=Coccomyxa viridis TaxID=1274662 RepID=A0ABP1FJZ6_9CHLO
MSPLADISNTPRLDSSTESQQANKGSNTPMRLDTPASEKAAVHFSERLQQAVETGDAATMGQAWQAVKTGSVQTDIDSLNALLKSFCRVNGDPSPANAEDLVAEVAKRGMLPNAATYHQLTAISVRHEQLAAHGQAW